MFLVMFAAGYKYGFKVCRLEFSDGMIIPQDKDYKKTLQSRSSFYELGYISPYISEEWLILYQETLFP